MTILYHMAVCPAGQEKKMEMRSERKPRMMPIQLADDCVAVVLRAADGGVKTAVCRLDADGVWLAYHHTHGRIGVAGRSPLDAVYTMMSRGE